MKKIKIPVIDFEQHMVVCTGNLIKDLETHCGTIHAYMDLTTEKIVEVVMLPNEYAYEIKLVKESN